MGKPASRPVKDMWWDDLDFHVVFADDGSEKVYKNAWLSRYDDGLKGTESFAVERVRFIGEFDDEPGA